MQGGHVAIKVNNQIGSNFQTKKGVRQGDPLSPILFNIVVDMLAILVKRAKLANQISGVIPNLVEDGLSILQYADDTIIFMDHNLDQARNLKLLLCAFEKLSGLKINFHKSEIFCFGQATDSETQYVQLFGCRHGSFPFRYLGIPMHVRKLRNVEWKTVEERIEKKLSSWKGKYLSFGGRLVLINSVLTSLTMFMLSFFEVPKGVLQKIEYYRSRFFWQSDNQKKKYRLIKWNIICQPKDQGGLGIQNIEIKNKCLLAKWLWKLINEEGLWQQILRNKYCKNYPIGIIERKPGDSHFWSGLMKVKDQFMRFGSFRLNNGQQIRFWEDVWIGTVSFQQKYPSLYNIVRKKNDTVASVLSSVPLNVSFRRSLQDNDLRNWNELVMSIMHIQLNDNKDTFKWNLKANRIFTVHSMYLAVINNGVVERNTMIWKLKMPLKLRFSCGICIRE
jgi:hypothetical protein